MGVSEREAEQTYPNDLIQKARGAREEKTHENQKPD
jgi:hypothetical protein